MQTENIMKFPKLQSGCQYCHLSNYCQSAMPPHREPRPHDKIIIQNHKYERGEHIYRTNAPFKSVYVVRSGSVKTYTNFEDGQEQVTGLHLAGKLLGLDDIGHNCHLQSAIALETSNICEISFSKLEHAYRKAPELQQILLYVMSDEIRADFRKLTQLSRLPAPSRLANFLLDLSAHYYGRGFSAVEFNLSLTRHDIANMLGLAVETVSRVFTQFQEDGLLQVCRRHIKIYDLEGLKRLAAGQRTQQRDKYHLNIKSDWHQPARV